MDTISTKNRKRKGTTGVDSTRRVADLAVEAARKHKAFDLSLIHVGPLSSIAEYFFICSCRSVRQAQAVAEHIQLMVKKHSGVMPLGVEGKNGGQWVLVDFGGVIVHVFYEPQREFYDLEGLWIEATRIDIGPEDPDGFSAAEYE